MPTIYDNSEGHTLADGLHVALQGASLLDACVGYFNIRGWRTVTKSIEGMKPKEVLSVRLMVGMLDRPDQVFLKHLRQRRDESSVEAHGGEQMKAALAEIRENLKEQLVSGVPNNVDLQTFIDLRDALRQGKVTVKAYLAERLHAKLYVSHNPSHPAMPRMAFVGSSNLTLAGLEGQGELNIDVTDVDSTEKLGKWFESKWDALNAFDISEMLADLIDESWINQVDPYLVHLKFAYELSQDAREGNAGIAIPSDIEPLLLDFQKSAVRTATRLLQRNQGVMVADVVGLGKTLTATAIARVLEEAENVETLIVCPKALVRMWQEYATKYQLRGVRVISLSMVKKELPDLGRFRLVVIDESHNLRNAGSQTYTAVKEYIAKNDPRVVLLTATPYNVNLSDIADQLALFLSEDHVLPVRPDFAIESVGGLAEFNKLTKGAHPNTLAAFRKSPHAEDWRKLLQYFLVRRTRGFIKKHYADKDRKGHYLAFPSSPENKLYFPRRVPHVLEVGEDSDEDEQVLGAVDLVAALKLARQGLGGYVLAKFDKDDDPLLRDLRNQRATLQGLTRTNLVKRRSSSAAAFSLSLQRHIVRDLSFIYALDNGKSLPIGSGSLVDTDIATLKDSEIKELVDSVEQKGNTLLGISSEGVVGSLELSSATILGEKAYERVTKKKSEKLRWVDVKYLDVPRLITDLKADVDLMFKKLDEIGVIDAATDPKIATVKVQVLDQMPKEKVLIFSEYQDTAQYLEAGLRHTHQVSNILYVNGQSSDLGKIARAFSPVSNADLGGLPEGMQPISVLITTDVLSEGQNLQDAHVVVNFDLPWALIRLVQRAGRVDRLGQASDSVDVFVLVPSKKVDDEIALRPRLQKRLIEAGAVLGGDDKFFGSDQEAQEISELLTGNSAALDNEEDNDVDPASYAFELWREAINNDPQIEQKVATLNLASRSSIRASDVLDSGSVISLVTVSGVQDTPIKISIDDGFKIISPVELLELSKCVPGTKSQTALTHHLDVLQDVAEGARSAFGTGLVALAGIKRQVYQRVKNEACLRDDGLMADAEARLAFQHFYEHPLSELAKSQFSSALGKESNSDLITRMKTLFHEKQLVIEESNAEAGTVQFVASMGLTGGKK